MSTTGCTLSGGPQARQQASSEMAWEWTITKDAARLVKATAAVGDVSVEPLFGHIKASQHGMCH